MEASPLLHHILIFLFLRTVIADIKLEDGCIKYNADTTITCTLPSGKSVIEGFIFWKFNSVHIVSNGGVIDNNPKYDTASTGTTFSLIIHNLVMSDIGSYTCEQGNDLDLDFNLMTTDIEDITCNATGGTTGIIISIEYNNKVVVRPAAEVDGQTITCIDVSTSAGEPTAGACTFNNLAAGTYSYTVNNHGACHLMCTGQVTVTGSSTSSPATKISTTVTPDLTTTGPATTSDKVASASTTTATTTTATTTTATTTTATTSSNSLKIVYGVCGSLGGIIILVFIAILIYKTKKGNAGNRYTQSNLQHINRRKDRSSNRYDNHGFADSTQDHGYKTQEPYNSHVSNHSARMSPDYEQQDRDDHNYQGMSGKYAPYSTGGNHSDEPMDVTYSTGGNHTDDPLDVTYYTGKSQRY